MNIHMYDGMRLGRGIVRGMVLVAWILGAMSVLADGEQPTRLRFRSGWLLATELAPENPEQELVVIGVSQFEPESSVQTNAGYAAVVVRLDPGRTLSLYDYVLEDRVGRQYPCIGLRVDDRPYNAGAWELDRTSSSSRYTMLFRVPVRVGVPAEFILRFALFNDEAEALSPPFRQVEFPEQFTLPSEIPFTGILGMEPETPAAEEKEDEAAADDQDGEEAELAEGEAAAADDDPKAKSEDTEKADGEPSPPGKANPEQIAEWEKALKGTGRIDDKADDKNDDKADEEEDEDAEEDEEED